MSDQGKHEARAHLGRAGRQSRDAARNAAEAAKLATSPIVEDVEHAAEETVETTKEVSKRINIRGLSAISGDTGTGFLALSVALYAGAVAYNKFSAVVKGRGRAVNR